MARRALFCLFVVLSTSGCGGGTKASDPPTLVEWHRVGSIELGEPKALVEQDYGGPGHGYHVESQARGIVQGHYVLHGGEVYVEFRDGRVNQIGFSTRYYRTKTGFGVGSRIPLGRCYRTKTDPCEHRWHGFIWNQWQKATPCGCWFKIGSGLLSPSDIVAHFEQPATAIFTSRGRVTAIDVYRKFVD